jgi:flagellar biosynthesis chaperone FliJ
MEYSWCVDAAIKSITPNHDDIMKRNEFTDVCKRLKGLNKENHAIQQNIETLHNTIQQKQDEIDEWNDSLNSMVYM